MTNEEKMRAVKDQSGFCKVLMDRLDRRTQNAKEGYMHPIEGRTQILADIKRIRRELMELSKML